VKFLIVAVNYFTKWNEAEELAQITVSANRVLLRELKRRLEKEKGIWLEELPHVSRAYHTM